MNYLLMNTANEELVLVLKKGEEIFSCHESGVKRHNEILLPKLQELLDLAEISLNDIDEFGVCVGPGSFTGIRVGVATVKAFKDVFNKPVRAINNLDLLYQIAKNQNLEIETVAIDGSLNSYFVGKFDGSKLNIYERNLTEDELKTVSENKLVAMYSNGHDFKNAVCVNFDDNAFVKCFLDSTNYDLTPIYYQLSQAENDKIEHGELMIEEADMWAINDIVRIENASFAPCWDEKVLNEALLNKNNTVFVAKLNELVVGFIIAENDIDEINISKVAVDKDYRNHGIATKLIERVEKLSKEKNINQVSLEVSSNNFTAKTLYEKLNYVLRRTRKNYYPDGSDAIEMFKQI